MEETERQQKKLSVNTNLLTFIIQWLKEKYCIFKSELKVVKYKLKNLAKANFELGIYHLYIGNINDAIMRFKIVLMLKPDHSLSYYYLAKSFLLKGKKNKAIEQLNIAKSKNYDCPEISYLSTVLDSSSQLIERIPNSIIEEYFDEYAEVEKKSLTLEKYSSIKSNFLLNVIKNAFGENIPKFKNILDLGCGYGSSVLVFKNNDLSIEVAGVDLSGKMIEVAEKKTISNTRLYSKLFKEDYIEYLSSCEDKFDLVIASDSLHYVADPTNILILASKTLNLDGFIVFSVEKSPDEDVRLNTSFTNFCFSKDYLEKLLENASFKDYYISELEVNNENYFYVVIKHTS